MHGHYGGVQSYATGIIVAYWIKLSIATYLIAYHQFGFRLPSLPFDVAFLLQKL